MRTWRLLLRHIDAVPDKAAAVVFLFIAVVFPTWRAATSAVHPSPSDFDKPSSGPSPAPTIPTLGLDLVAATRIVRDVRPISSPSPKSQASFPLPPFVSSSSSPPTASRMTSSSTLPPPLVLLHSNIKVRSPVVAGPRQVYLATGLPGRLDCPIPDDPPTMLIVWLKDGRQLDKRQTSGRGNATAPRSRRPTAQAPSKTSGKPRGKGRSTRVRGAAGGGGGPRVRVGRGGTLFFRSPDRRLDEGLYTCFPYSPMVVGRESDPVQVLVRDPPYFVVRPKPFYHRQPMQNIHLPCVAVGDPTPTVSWRRMSINAPLGGGDFPSDTRTLQDGGNLTIARLTPDDQGLYECVASNVIADVITTSFIIIELTSRHPAFNVTVTTTPNSAHLSWYPAYDSGLSQLYTIWYTLQKSGKETGNETWDTVDVYPLDSVSAAIYELEPDSIYRFRVQSRTCCITSASGPSQTVTSSPVAPSYDAHFSDPVTVHTKKLNNVGDESSSGRTSRLSTELPYEKNAKRRRPARPENITAQLDNGVLLISWQAPLFQPTQSAYMVLSSTAAPDRPRTAAAVFGPTSPSTSQHHVALSASGEHATVSSTSGIASSSSVDIQYFVVEYRTVGPWVPLSGQVLTPTTNFRWTTASRGATYHFRVRSYSSVHVASEPSDVVTIYTGDPMADGTVNAASDSVAGTLAALVAFLVVLSVALAGAVRHLWRRHSTCGRLRQNDVKSRQLQLYDTIQYTGTSGNHGDSADIIMRCSSPAFGNRRHRRPNDVILLDVEPTSSSTAKSNNLQSVTAVTPSTTSSAAEGLHRTPGGGSTSSGILRSVKPGVPPLSPCFGSCREVRAYSICGPVVRLPRIDRDGEATGSMQSAGAAADGISLKSSRSTRTLPGLSFTLTTNSALRSKNNRHNSQGSGCSIANRWATCDVTPITNEWAIT